jgi:hypothetical protein
MRSSVVALSQLGLLDLPQRPKVPDFLIEQPASGAGHEVIAEVRTSGHAAESELNLMDGDRIDDWSQRELSIF